MRSNGVILWEGPSLLDGAPVVCILTGLRRPSSNLKTGPMLQTWILHRDVVPAEAVRSGDDAAICGACPLRGSAGFTDRRCYVNVGQGPGAVWRAYKAGRYPGLLAADGLSSTARFELREQLKRGTAVRLGAYGDPAAVPIGVWSELLRLARTWTGYTHQWRRPDFDARLLDLCMASVESPLDVLELERRHPGARYFRVRKPGEAIGPMRRAEVQCPATAEGGYKATCATCQLCGGSAVRARSVSIAAHGATVAGAWGRVNRWRRASSRWWVSTLGCWPSAWPCSLQDCSCSAGVDRKRERDRV